MCVCACGEECLMYQKSMEELLRYESELATEQLYYHPGGYSDLN